jgi:hypothetical protein
MKNFQSTAETVWIEQLKVELTESERELMRSQNEENEEARNALFERVKAEREQLVTEEKNLSLNTFYNTIKPAIKDTDTYQLIACNCIEVTAGFYSGILNFRINGEHKQIRF